MSSEPQGASLVGKEYIISNSLKSRGVQVT